MNMERKRYIRRLMPLGQCSSFARWTVGGFAFFFAVLPWLMLGVLCSTGFSGTPSGQGAFFLFAYLAAVSLFYHYTRAVSVHWRGYPFYPEDRSLISRVHHAVALIAVSGIVLVPWSWSAALAVVAGLCVVDILFDSKAMRFGEQSVRAARVRFNSILATLTEAGSSSAKLSRSTGLPGIFRGDEEVVNESNESLEDTEPDANTTQCQKRKLQMNGLESVEGMVRVSFKAGEEQTAVHLAFCPSLSTAPEIQTELISDLAVEVEADVTQSQMYGARIELKRSGSRDLPAQTVSVYYYASVPAVCERIAQ